MRRHLHFVLVKALALEKTAAMLQNAALLPFDRLLAAPAWPGFT